MKAAVHESINRIEKLIVERQVARTFGDASHRLDSFDVTVIVDPRRAANACAQVALATFVILAVRYARGGVHVVGAEAAENQLPGVPGTTLRAALSNLGARMGPPEQQAKCEVLIGCAAARGLRSPSIRVGYGRWWASVGPSHMPAYDGGDNALGAIAAGALAASEVFYCLLDPERTLRDVRDISLLPNIGLENAGPAIQFLPNFLWIVGLGHIGQAISWCLSLLPYRDPAAVTLVLQDTDPAGVSTTSTSVLTGPHDVGQLKTRIASSWLERRGFATRLIERKFDANTRCEPEDPRAVLVAVDNAAARHAVANAGFDLMVDAGIGARAANFDAITIRTLPGTLDREDLWQAGPRSVDALLALEGYRELANTGLNECGLTQIAEKAVGVPFVGMMAACVSISQLLRLLHGRGADEVLSVRMRSLGDTERVANARLPASMSFGFQEV